MAWLDYYQQHGPEAVSGKDLDVPPGRGTGGQDTLYHLREGIERFTVKDINDPAASGKAHPKFPSCGSSPARATPTAAASSTSTATSNSSNTPANSP